MPIERPDSIYDIAAMEKEHIKFQEMLKQDTEALMHLYSIRNEAKGGGISTQASNSEKVNTAIENQIKLTQKLKQEGAAVLTLMNQRYSADAKATTAQTDYAKATIRTTTETQKYNKELKASVAAEQAHTGSRERAMAQIRIMTIQKDKLNLVNEAEKKQYDQLVIKIERYNKFLKDTGTSAEKQRMNVGNYQGSAKIIVDAMERARIKVEEVSRSLGATSPEAKSARTQFEALQRITAGPKFLNISAKVGDVSTEVRFFTNQLSQLRSEGLQDTKVFKETEERISELSTTIRQTREEVKALSSEHRSFDLFAGSVTFAADTVETFAGAIALAGGSEEDAAQATKTLIAIQSVANGVKGISKELTEKGTAANKLFEFSQRQVAVAMDTTASAGARLKGALSAIGIGALILAIGFLVTNWSKIQDALSGVSKQQKILNDLTEKAIEGATEETTKVKLLVLEYQNENTTKKRKKEIQDDLQKDYPAYFGNMKTEKEFAEGLTAAYKKLGEALFIKSKIQAASAIITENETKALKAEFEASQVTDKRAGADIFGSLVGKRSPKEMKRRKDELLAQATDYREANDFLIKTIQDSQKKLDDLGGDPSKDVAKPDKKDKKADKSENERLKNRLELEKRNAEALSALMKENANERIRLNQAVADNEENEVGVRMNAEKSLQLWKKSLALQEYNETIASEKKLEGNKVVIVEKSDREKLLALTQYNNKVKVINEETAKAELDIIKQNDEKKRAQIEKDQQLELDLLLEGKDQAAAKMEQGYNEDILLLNNRLESGKISQKEYNKQRAYLDEAYHIQSLQAEIDYTSKVLAIMKLRGIDVSKEQAALAKLQVELSEISKNHFLKNEDEKSAKIKETLGKIQEAYQVFSEVVSGFLNASFTAQKNKIQEEINLIDKRKEAELAANDKRTQSDQDRAANAIVINSRAQAQKEALERRQKQMDHQKAQADKALAIFQIILSTAVNVAKALNPFAKALAAISGAAQLAIAIATPIPKYKGGRGTGKQEFAITGDGGVSEYIHTADGIFKTPAVDTLVHLMPGDKVYKDKETMIRETANGSQALSYFSVNPNGSITRNDMKEFAGDIVRAVGNIEVNNLSITKEGWRQTNQRMADKQAWVQKTIKG